MTLPLPPPWHRRRRLPPTLPQAVHKQVASEPLLDVLTEEGRHLAGLPAGDCCLQVREAPVPDLPLGAGRSVGRSVGWVWHGLFTHLRRRLPAAPQPPWLLLLLQNERDDTVDDLVKSDFLHEPGCGGGCRGCGG